MPALALRGALLPEESDDQVGSENIFCARMDGIDSDWSGCSDGSVKNGIILSFFCHLNMFQSFWQGWSLYSIGAV